MDRAQHYLRVLLTQRGKWIHIKKLKRQIQARDNTKERQEVMVQIESALKLMGIKFQKSKTFKIRILNEKQQEAVHQIKTITFSAQYGQQDPISNGKGIKAIIIDDVY